MTTFMSLNIDILSCIVFWLTPYQAGQLSVTCRKTYEVATKRALSKLSLNKHPDQVREVYEATYSKALYRLLWLDELSLECWVLYPGYPNDEEESAASQVVQLLEGARNLKRLRISFFEHLIKKEPSVVYAISSLQRLSHITLFGIGPQALQLLSTLQSSPRGLELYFTKKPPEPLDLTDTLQYFSRFRTLAALSLGSMLFHIKDNCHLRLPSVLDLSVGRLLGPLSFLPDIFPHVRALTIYAAVPSIAPTVTLHPTLTHWSALDKICGNFSVLHKPIILAGPHIRRVEISEKDPCRDEGRLFLDIIKATSPVVLHTKLNRSLGTSFYQDLVRLAPNLTHLSLHVIYPLLGFRCAWWLEHIPQVLALAPILYLSLSLEFEEKDAAKLLDCPATIARAMPSLKFISLWRGTERLTYRVSRSLDSGGQSTLEALTPEVADRIIASFLDANRESAERINIVCESP